VSCKWPGVWILSWFLLVWQDECSVDGAVVENENRQGGCIPERLLYTALENYSALLCLPRWFSLTDVLVHHSRPSCNFRAAETNIPVDHGQSGTSQSEAAVSCVTGTVSSCTTLCVCVVHCAAVGWKRDDSAPLSRLSMPWWLS
jgi:hypothetical protein